MPTVAVLRTYEDQAKGLYLAVFFWKNTPVNERVHGDEGQKVSFRYIKMTYAHLNQQNLRIVSGLSPCLSIFSWRISCTRSESTSKLLMRLAEQCG